MEIIEDKFNKSKDTFNQNIINKKIGLVLSGGGAKGIFQAHALDLLRKEYQMKFDYVSGVSIGALNGLYIATDRQDQLVDIWDQLKEEDFITKKNKFVIALRYLMYKIGIGKPPRSLYDNSELRNFLLNEFKDIKDIKPFYAGRVDLTDEKYYSLVSNENEKLIIDKVIASTSIPVTFDPVEMDDKVLVDGGVRNISPLKEVIKHNPDLIVVITTEPLAKYAPVKSNKVGSFGSIASISLSIMLDEIFNNDIENCIDINHYTKMANEAGYALRNRNGRPMKYFDTIVIQPSVTLGSALDFDKDIMEFRAENAIGQTHFAMTRYMANNKK